jgi:hypothetical protein
MALFRFLIAAALCIGAETASAQRYTIPFPDQVRPAAPLPPQDAVSKGMRPEPNTAAGRVRFAEQLTASFRSAGFSMRVSSQEASPGSENARGLPRLLITGLFDDAFVYRIKTTGNFLDPALKTGFRSVEIASQIDRRRAVFDLSGGRVPSCDTTGRICN